MSRRPSSSPGSDLRYLTGIAGSSFERLTALVVPSDAAVAPVFVSPALEYAGLGHVPLGELGVEVRTWVDGEDPYAAGARRRAARSASRCPT